MARAVARLAKQMPTLEAFIQAEYLDEAGLACIQVNLRGGEVFDPRSLGRGRCLSRELLEFLDAKMYPVPVRYPLRILFCGGDLSGEEQAQVERLLRSHYTGVLRDKGLDLRMNAAKILGLAALGVLLLGLWFGLGRRAEQPLLMEFLSIAGTFALWQAVDFYVLERRSLQVERLNAGQSALAEVEFLADKND